MPEYLPKPETPTPPGPPPEAHPAQRFANFVCREIDLLTKNRQAFQKIFTVYLKEVDRGFYIAVSVLREDYDRINVATLSRMKKEAAVESARQIYDHADAATRDEIFTRGELAFRDPQGVSKPA